MYLRVCVLDELCQRFSLISSFLERFIMLKSKRMFGNAVMIIYKTPVRFSLLLHLLYIFQLWSDALSLISLRTSVYNSINLSNTVEHPRKHILLGTHIYDDIQLLKKLLSCFEFVGTLLWLACILLQSGDIHPNPGPSFLNHRYILIQVVPHPLIILQRLITNLLYITKFNTCCINKTFLAQVYKSLT